MKLVACFWYAKSWAVADPGFDLRRAWTLSTGGGLKIIESVDGCAPPPFESASGGNLKTKQFKCVVNQSYLPTTLRIKTNIRNMFLCLSKHMLHLYFTQRTRL